MPSESKKCGQGGLLVMRAQEVRTSVRGTCVAFDTKFRIEMARVKAGGEAVDEMKKSKITLKEGLRNRLFELKRNLCNTCRPRSERVLFFQ